jgi:membrane protein implicated in regulation of membrane protease activity
VVTRRVDANGGQIRIGEGEFWSARAFDPADVMEPGAPVEVVLVDGLTALVSPVIRPVREIEDQEPIEKGM